MDLKTASEAFIFACPDPLPALIKKLVVRGYFDLL